jgi:hypothetical protein
MRTKIRVMLPAAKSARKRAWMLITLNFRKSSETASKVAYELGRKDAGEEIALALEAYVEHYPEDIFPPDSISFDCIGANAMRHAYPNAARIARETVGAVSDEHSGEDT